jgi:tetratricopeptide (TPR) repeat protein
MMKPQFPFLLILVLFLALRGPAYARPAVDSLTASAKDSLLQAGMQQYSEYRFSDAVRTLSAIPKDSSSSRALYYLGLSYASMNDFQNAYDCLREAVVLDTLNSAFRFQYAKFLGQFGAVDEAQHQYEMIVQSDTTFYPAYFQLGILLNAQRKFPKREAEIFSRIVQYQPRDYLSLHFLGDALIRTGQFDAGRACIATSITLNPKHFPAVYQLAGIYFSKSDFQEALRLYKQAALLHPFDPTVDFTIGECLRKLRNDSAAVEYYQKALLLDSTESKYAAQLGYSFFNLHQYESSIAAYKRAIAIDNEDPQYWLNLALVYQRIDSAENAIDAFEQAVSASRPDKIADIYLQLGSYQFRRSDFRGAIAAYSKALDFEAHNSEAQFYLGLTYEQLASPKSAVRHYRAYLKLTEEDTSTNQRRELAKRRIDWLQKQQ